MAETQRTPNRAGEDRRQRIVDALDACIRRTGFAGASLTDIAVEAGISPSHVRYYFESKEDILEYYLSSLSAEILAEIERIERKDPERWLEEFSRYFSSNPKVSSTGIGVLMEIFGVSVHHPKLAAIKRRHDKAIRRVFRDFFEWAGVAPGFSLDDAAYTGWALDSGMKFNAAFQEDFSLERAGVIFRREMRRLAGWPSKEETPPPPKRGSRRRV